MLFYWECRVWFHPFGMFVHSLPGKWHSRASRLDRLHQAANTRHCSSRLSTQLDESFTDMQTEWRRGPVETKEKKLKEKKEEKVIEQRWGSIFDVLSRQTGSRRRPQQPHFSVCLACPRGVSLTVYPSCHVRKAKGLGVLDADVVVQNHRGGRVSKKWVDENKER